MVPEGKTGMVALVPTKPTPLLILPPVAFWDVRVRIAE
jgi:hypothetical protein